MGFKSDLGAQQLEYHCNKLREIGYRPIVIADEAEPLRDLYCPSSGMVFECKTDRHKPINAAIELMSNLAELPSSLSSNRRIEPHTSEYQIAKQWMRDVWTSQPKKLALGLSPSYDRRLHSVCYAFPSSDTFYLLSMRNLQERIVFPSIREEAAPLLWTMSREGSRCWYSLCLLAPVALLAVDKAAANVEAHNANPI
jgi:hypothetical protein